MSINEIVDIVRSHNDCTVLPVSDLTGEIFKILPTDLQEFYKICGGMTLYKSSDYPMKIVEPELLVRANNVIVGEPCEDDISYSWYIIADDMNGDYLTTDLDPSRLGRCYDSFHDRHGIVGESKIIALSFTDLLAKLVENKGEYWYWLSEDFEDIGDAYDNE